MKTHTHTHTHPNGIIHIHVVTLCLCASCCFPHRWHVPPDPWPHCDIMEHYSSCSYSSYLVLFEEKEERDWAGSTESLGMETWRSRTSTDWRKEQKRLERLLKRDWLIMMPWKTRERLICIYVQFTAFPFLKNQGRGHHVWPFLSNRYFVFHSNVAKPCIVAKLLFSAQDVYVQTALCFNCILWVRILVVQLAWPQTHVYIVGEFI